MRRATVALECERFLATMTEVLSDQGGARVSQFGE
jgi:hypothetical protein